MSQLGPASFAWTMRRSEECRYRPTSLQRSQPSSRLTRRTKAPCQLTCPAQCAVNNLMMLLSQGRQTKTSPLMRTMWDRRSRFRSPRPSAIQPAVATQPMPRGDACAHPKTGGPTGSARWQKNCPYWIQHVADAASVLLRHAYELSIGAECRFAGYRSQTGSPEPTEETDLTECIVKFEWLFGASARSYQAGVPFQELSAACDVHCVCLLYTSPSPRDGLLSRMPSSA